MLISRAATDKPKSRIKGRKNEANNGSLLERILNQLSTAVSVALVKDGKTAYEFFGGKRSAADAKQRSAADGAVSGSSRFNLGTATSFITAALAVKMMEFGEISLSDRVSKLVPDFPFPDITVYHLVTHTTGLSVGVMPEPSGSVSQSEYYSALFREARAERPAGEVSVVDACSSAALANVIERVSGQSLEDLAATTLFLPAGMRHTTYGNAGLPYEDIVTPRGRLGNGYIVDEVGRLPVGHTGVHTTVGDLAIFGQTLLDGGARDGRQVFLESSADFMLREITGGRFMRTPLFMIKGSADAFGCFSRLHSPRAVAITGNFGGMLFVDPDKRAVGALLTNNAWVGSANRNFRDICDILLAI